MPCGSKNMSLEEDVLVLVMSFAFLFCYSCLEKAESSHDVFIDEGNQQVQALQSSLIHKMFLVHSH